jgi:tetratricopeptide (TPR) repeat protein
MIILMIACQKSKQSYPVQILKAEKILINKPTTALSMLDSVKGTIKNQPTETQRYYDLLLFRAHDMCYFPHTSNDSIQKCIAYYTKNFNNDKLMTAYYCMGCFYRDKEDYVKASQAYQKALNYASQSKNYSLIGRIYNQLAHLSGIPKETIPLYKKSAVYFEKAKDNITLMYSIRDIAMSFSSEDLNDSAVYYGEKAYNMARSLNDSTCIQVMNSQMASYYLRVNKINEAKYLLDQTLLNPHDENDNSLCYLDWGEYHQAVGNNDSAIHYYKKCIQGTTDINFKYSSNKALYDIYKEGYDFKKALACADSLLYLDNKNLLITHDVEVTKQNIRFGVKRMEKENSRLSEKVEYHKTLIFGLTIVFILFVIVGLSVMKKRELRHQEELVKKVKDQMSKNNNTIINERIKQINDLEEELKKANEEVERQKHELESLPKREELMAQIEENKILEEEFFSSSIYALSYKNVQTGKTITVDQWTEFKTAVNHTYDNFNYRLKALYPKISEQEIRICDLMKSGFTTEQMANALNCTLSNTYSIRRRLYKKRTALSGSAGDLDKWISEF